MLEKRLTLKQNEYIRNSNYKNNVMETYKTLFKQDFWRGLTDLAKSVFLNSLYSYLIYYFSAAIITIGLLLIGVMLSPVDWASVFELLQSGTPTSFQIESDDPMVMFDKIKELFLHPAMVICFVLAILISVVISSWSYLIVFLNCKNEVEETPQSYGELLNQSLRPKLMNFVGVILLLTLIYVILFALAGASMFISVLLGFALLLLAGVFYIRLFLVLPAYIIGEKPLNEAFAFSLHHIHWGRAFKFLGIGIIIFIALMVVGLILAVVIGLLTFIPGIGTILQYLFNVLIGAIGLALMVSAMTGLYYRYAPAKGEDATIESELWRDN